MHSAQTFQSIWTYEVREQYRAAFIDTYGPDGAWAVLFRQCPGYIRTELIVDAGRRDRFLTIDYWQSQAAFLAMKQHIGDAYDALDATCEDYTLSEQHIGYFSSL